MKTKKWTRKEIASLITELVLGMKDGEDMVTNDEKYFKWKKAHADFKKAFSQMNMADCEWAVKKWAKEWKSAISA
jgi:hypothetical protein